MGPPLHLLIVEDSSEDAELVALQLQRGGYDLTIKRVDTEPEFKAELAGGQWDLVISDYNLPQFSAGDALAGLKASGRDLPFIIVSGAIGEEVAVAAMKAGAHDYILKHSLARLVPAVERELREAQVRWERRVAGEAYSRLAAIVQSSGDAIIGKKLDGTITSWNAGAERIYGFSAAETIGRSVLMLVPSDRMDEQKSISVRLERGETIDPFDTVRLRQGGERIDTSVTISPITDADGRTLGASDIARDITAGKRAEAELRNSREQLRALAAHLQSVREEERKRIAREIHDELGQSLTGFKMDLVWIRNTLETGTDPASIQTVTDKMKTMSRLLDDTADLVRNLCSELRPGILDDLGLHAAMEWQAREYQKRTNIICDLRLDENEPAVDADRATAIFRIFQELLTNVARHAGASRIEATLRTIDNHIILEVRDNGRGIKSEQKAGKKSLGLLGMRERAVILGGQVDIDGRPGEGTTVRVRVPLPVVSREPTAAARDKPAE